MADSDLIKLLQKLVEYEETPTDESKVSGVIEKILSLTNLKAIVSGEGEVGLSVSTGEIRPYLRELGIPPDQEKKYVNLATKRILGTLGELIFNEKQPENEFEKKVFEKFNVPDMRTKAKLKREYSIPVVDGINLYRATLNIDEPLEYYLLKIEHMRSKKPNTVNFIITKNDLKKFREILNEVLKDGDVS
ncbi:hypothetical protein A3L12_05740 [Thermococcus sp. P6]|uniref:hypothetical protein n=1 Tax=Thermococcus sp. P6 TaxID=122420 RepID=UPI000B598D8D|nr:hypothetical protein [Thermococcus sp. P6]ASJ10837.1 hypothetical protein A3L12_05740 [Thermococcus sp. P6]